MATIERMLVLSTGHVGPNTARCLDLGVIPSMAREEGWLLYVPTDDDDDVPADLARIFQFARGMECEWVLLDRDGEIEPSLPWWEW